MAIVVNDALIAQEITDTLTGKQVGDVRLIEQVATNPTLLSMVMDRLRQQNAPEAEKRLSNIFAASTISSVVTAARPTDKISAEAYWWGYELFLPEPVMRDLNNAAGGDFVKVVTGLVTAAATAFPVIAPFVAVIVAFIIAEFVIMKNIDRGNGDKLSAIWLAPTIYLPTPL